MGMIKREDQTNQITITYGGRECPFTGVGLDSSAPPAYIAPNGFNQIQNALINNNQLTLGSVSMNVSPQTYIFQFPNAVSIGMGDLSSIPFEVQYDPNAVGGSTIYVYTYGLTDTNPPILLASFVLPIAPAGVGTLTYKNINGVCYFSAPGLYYIFQHNNATASILTTYLGCSFLGELNGRLLACNVFQEQYTTGQVSQSFTPSAVGPTTANQTTAGSTTVDSTDQTIAPSQAVPAGLSLTINTNVVTAAVFSTDGVGQGNVSLQYSIDSGTTWATFYSTLATTSGVSPSSVQTITFAAPANINQVKLRAVVSATVFASGTANIQVTFNDSTLSVPNTATPVVNEYPYQVAWSAALGAYGIWNPLDVNGLVTGAGYNNLPDVEDIITGFFTTGPTGYVLRQQGISEITGLNSGIQPFDFNILWASHKGIGAVFSEGVQQYGSVGYFVSDTDIYTVGYDGINVIAGPAKSAIYAFVNNPTYSMISGVGTISIGNEPFLAYVLAFYASDLGQVYYFIYKAETKEWVFGYFQSVGGANQFTNLNIGNIYLPNLGFNVSSSIIFNVQFSATGAAPFQTNLFSIGNFLDVPITPSFTSLIFPEEEIDFGRIVTIDAIGIYVYNSTNAVIEFNGVNNLQILIQVNGIQYNVWTAPQGNNYSQPTLAIPSGWSRLFVTPAQPYTGLSPQLIIQISQLLKQNTIQPLVIGKVIMYGALTGAQRPI